MKVSLIVLILFLAPDSLFAQEEHSSNLNRSIESNDSLLFNVGFNRGDTAPFVALLSDNFEMYHDEAGPITSKAAFIESIKSLKTLNYKPIRKLISFQVYALLKNGTIYGAIESGEHKFYAQEKDKPEYLTRRAKFTHLWLIEDGKWKLSRVFSFDHRKPGKYRK